MVVISVSIVITLYDYSLSCHLLFLIKWPRLGSTSLTNRRSATDSVILKVEGREMRLRFSLPSTTNNTTGHRAAWPWWEVEVKQIKIG
jgi:hypothetical protein